MNSPAQLRIGARLRAARGDRPLSAVAALIGVSATTVMRWETGRFSPPVDLQLAIADALGRAWGELFYPGERQPLTIEFSGPRTGDYVNGTGDGRDYV